MAVLAIIEPLDLALDERVVLRLSSDASVAAASHDGEAWWPAIPTPPTLGIDLFDGDFTSPVDVSTGQMGIRMDVVNELSGSVRDFNWADAPVQLFDVRDGTAYSLFVGKVTRFAMEDFLLQLTMAVDTEPFEIDVLGSEYAGTTGIEGGDDIKGRVKPWVFGRALNVEPVLIDAIDNVYQVSAYGPIHAINAVYERGASFGPAEGDYANYDALVAADISEGEWATCLAQGLFRLGAPQAGVITCDVDGDNGGGFLRRTGAILLRIAEVLGISTALIDEDSLEQLDLQVPYNVNVVISGQISLLDLAQAMAAPCNAVAGVSMLGKLFTSRVVLGNAVLTLDAQGRQIPPVLGAARQTVRPPYKRIKMGAAQCWRVHTFDEIAFYAELIARGGYDAGTVYREGNIVTTSDSARWVYINETPGSGNAPPVWPTTSNAYWSNLDAPLTAENIAYTDGTPIEDLQPAEPGATEGAVVPTPGSGASGNVRDEVGALYDPGELLNSSLELTPAGVLQFRPLPGVEPVARGQITLPDLGAASEVALRKAEDDVDALATALSTALDEASRTRETFTDAGFYTDPATGQVRIHAVEQTSDRLNSVDLRLDAAEASITLRATTSYVDQAIAEAVLDPSQIADLDTIFLRLTTAELDIDGLEATVTTLATVTELTALTGRVTTAETELDALEGVVSTKVDTTTFNALDTRVTTAESTLTALGDTAQIVNAVTSIRLIEREVDANAEGALAALVQDDRNQRDQVIAVASARQELRTEITDGLTAEATARLALQVQVDDNAASLATESLTRASEDAALASQITALEASTSTNVATLEASITAEQTARTNADSALAADITELDASFTSALNTETAAREAAVTTLTASLSTESSARADADSALADSVATLQAGLTTETSQRQAAITTEQQARVNADAALAADITSLEAGLATETSQRQAAITAANQARVDGDATIAASVTSLTTTVNGQTATLATYGESIDGLEARYGVRLDVNGRITGFQQNNDGSQGGFTVVADNFQVIDPDLGPGGTPVTVLQILNGVISGAAINFNNVIGSNKPENNADVTATAQRSIIPQFPVIEIKQGEAGHTGNRTVTHVAKRGTTTLTGGTWSLPSTNVGAGSATINSSTGTVTLSGIVASGAYTVRYTHTDGAATDLPVNVTYVPAAASGTVSAKSGSSTSSSGVGNNNNWTQVISLTLTGCPAGRLFFNKFGLSSGTKITISSGTGTCSHAARLLINGSVVASLPSQPTMNGGAAEFFSADGLFDDAYTTPAGTVTVAVELQRTTGTGTITVMSNKLDCNVIAT